MKTHLHFIIATILAGLVSSNAHAQAPTWFPENAEWYYTTWCINDPNCGFLRYYTAGDTTLAGEDAVRVRSQYQNDDEITSETAVHYFSVHSDTVFYFSDVTQTWGLLYDFNAQPGDIWDLTQTLAMPVEGAEGYVSAIIQVDSITVEELGGMSRRVIYTSPYYDQENQEPESEWQFIGPIVEGVGPVGASSGLLGESVYQVLGGIMPRFSCYREHAELVLGSPEYPCGVVSGVSPEKEVSPMHVYPNPTTGRVLIELPASFANRANIVVYNLAGQVVATHEQFDVSKALLLPTAAGIYLLEGHNNQHVVRTKVVVE